MFKVMVKILIVAHFKVAKFECNKPEPLPKFILQEILSQDLFQNKINIDTSIIIELTTIFFNDVLKNCRDLFFEFHFLSATFN